MFLLFILFSCDWSLWVYNENFIIGQTVEVIDEEVDF